MENQDILDGHSFTVEADKKYFGKGFYVQMKVQLEYGSNGILKVRDKIIEYNEFVEK